MEVPRCQGITSRGTQCSRKGVWYVDLRQGKKLLGYQVVPPIDCCFYCKQHLLQLAAAYSLEFYLSKLSSSLLTPEQKDWWNASGFMAKHDI